jgi:hypothetical protein
MTAVAASPAIDREMIGWANRHSDGSLMLAYRMYRGCLAVGARRLKLLKDQGKSFHPAILCSAT